MIKDSYIRECYENNDIEGLRNVFVYAPDRDPSFEMFRNDYNECRDKLFEPYVELTPFADRGSGKWSDESYLTALRLDLMKNFSQKRYEHLLEVSKVYYKVAEKSVAPKPTPQTPKPEISAPKLTPPIQKREPADPTPRRIPTVNRTSEGDQSSNFRRPPQATDYADRTNPPKGMSAEEKNRAAAERYRRTAITVGIALALVAAGAIVLLLILNT